MIRVTFRLNGEERTVDAAPDMRLSEILRETLGLTATKIACGIGRCGACMTLIDGEAVNSCLVMAYRLDGAEVLTSEGLDALPVGKIVRAAFAEEAAFQCGYCASGFVIALTGLLAADPNAGEDRIRQALEGNLCRCSGYLSILRGATRAVEMLADIRERERP